MLNEREGILRPSPVSLPLTRTFAFIALSCKSATELVSVEALILRVKQPSPLPLAPLSSTPSLE